MNNNPKCVFCEAPLVAETIHIDRELNPVYSMGSRKPYNMALPEEITLTLRCPKCGAFGDGLGDKVQIISTNGVDVEVNHVMVGHLTIGEHFPEVYLNRHFNPSRRDNSGR